MALNFNKSFIPIYQQVAEHLRDEIEQGRISPGERLPSEPELARHFGINHLTLRKGMKILREQNLIYQHPGKGTYVIDKKKEEQKTPVIGILGMPNKMTDPYYSVLLSGLQSEASNCNISPLFINDKDVYSDIVGHYKHYNLNGLIIFSPLETEVDAIKKLQAASIPYVIMGASFNIFKKNNFNCVNIDHQTGTIKAIDYLISLGHKRIVYIGIPSKHHVGKQIFDGYRKSLKKHNIAYDPDIVFRNPLNQTICEKIGNEILNLSPQPTAAFIAGHTYIVRLWQFFESRGIKIPDNISIAGYDNYGYCKFLTPTLTTVDQPVYEMGKWSVNFLNEQISAKETVHKFILLNSEFILGNSCKPLKPE